jgi:aspartate aminotransferase
MPTYHRATAAPLPHMTLHQMTPARAVAAPRGRSPRITSALEATPLSPFVDIEQRLARYPRAFRAPLHQGKTTFSPHADGRGWGPADFELRAGDHAPPSGVRSLRRRIAALTSDRLAREVDEGCVVMTCGATQGMDLTLRCIVEPGDDVLVLSPQWLFAVGLVRAARARPVEVPVFLELDADAEFDFIAALEARIGPRTRALVFNTPNNPTGQSLSADALSAIADLAERHDLWIVSDNAYEHYDLTAEGFVDISRFEQAADRTVSLHSFSKTGAMPGHRVGYVVVPEALAIALQKLSLHSTYSVATSSQYAAWQALDVPAATLADQRREVRRARDRMTALLDVPHSRVEGGLYTFLDLTGWPGGADGFVDRCVEVGVSLAPGRAFGAHCADRARLCFTAVDLQTLEEAIHRINHVHGGTDVPR